MVAAASTGHALYTHLPDIFRGLLNCCAAVLLIWSMREQQMAPKAEWSAVHYLEGLAAVVLSVSLQSFLEEKPASWIVSTLFTSLGDVFYCFTVSLAILTNCCSSFELLYRLVSHFFTELGGGRRDRHDDNPTAKLCSRDRYITNNITSHYPNCSVYSTLIWGVGRTQFRFQN